MEEVGSVPDRKGALQLWISENDEDNKKLDLGQINDHKQYPSILQSSYSPSIRTHGQIGQPNQRRNF